MDLRAVKETRAALECLDLRDLPERRVRPVQVDNRGQMVIQVLLDHLDLLDLQAPLDQPGQVDSQVLQVPPDLTARPVL